MMKQKIYCIPGLGAKAQIFDYLQLDENKYELVKIDWIEPKKDEPLEKYIQRLIQPIQEEQPILMGVSFGGIVVQEIAKQLPCKKVFVVSSIKSKEEFPNALRYIYQWNLYKAFPSNYLKTMMDWADKYLFVDAAKKKVKLYRKYLVKLSPYYFDWSIRQALEWEGQPSDANVVHIHGTDDHIFPSKYICENVRLIQGGTHAMILTHARELTKIVEQELEK
ncbi:alpha/beta fold hydrolase [Capnocytophaga sp. ARDL2]|uniref:alpha/beta fold hydrolase n=1 Tax=Capnocytophaga sp. ARDL2 TaxID=3238809 RepID=UPI003556C025